MVRWVIYVIRVFRRQYRSLRCSISANFSRHAEELLSTFATMAAARSAIAKILPLFLCEKRPSQATFATRRGGVIAIFRNSPKSILLKTLASIGASIVWSSLPIAVVTALPTTSSVVSKMHLMLPFSAVIVKLCDTHNIPLATNLATAELLIKAMERGDFEFRNVYRKG